MRDEWTREDRKTVVILTLINGLWFGALLWLILGVWLDLVGFFPCWIGATLFSWIVAVWRVGRGIMMRTNLEEELEPASDEVETVLATIDAVEKEEGAEGLFQIKRLVVREVVDNEDKTKYSINNDNFSARTLVFLTILNVLSVELISGKYHTYRGVLNITTGEQLLRLWDYAVEQQKLSGYYDEEKARKDTNWIRNQIEKAG